MTIPDAPDYEINGYFKVRNKKTGRILHNKKRVDRRTVVTALWYNNKQIKRDVKSFYHQALMNVLSPGGWFPVHSLQCKYEINCFGEARNTQTKKLVKPIFDQNSVYYHFSIGGKNVHRLKSRLIAEVFGRGKACKKKPVPVILRKDGQAYYFESKYAAARFLAPKVFYAFETIARRMTDRQKEIYGWQAKYLG